MAEIVIRPATADRFDDVEHALSGGGDGASCQCQWWTLTTTQWQASSRGDREELLRQELDGAVAPGLIAFVDGEAAGWVRVGPRIAQPRLARTREFQGGASEPWTDPSVWAVSCFVVRREFRGQGLSAALLEAAIDYARTHGARLLQGYPIDTTFRAKSANHLYRGILADFEKAGFIETGRPKPDRAVVAREL